MKTQAIWSFECCWSTFKKYYLTPHNFYSWPILIYFYTKDYVVFNKY